MQIDSAGTPDMIFSEVRGIFYTLFVGIITAYIMGVIEFLVYIQKAAVMRKQSFKNTFVYEVKLVFNIWNNKKSISVNNLSI